MRSSVYINEITPEAVTLDLSASPSVLTEPQISEGYAFSKTIEHLGLKMQVEPPIDLAARLRIDGTVENIRNNLPRLQKHIGLISRYSADKDRGNFYISNWVGRTLGNLVQRTLPNLPENASLMRAMGLIVEPFADYTNDDGAIVFYGRRHWGAGPEHSVVKNENGEPLGPFSARDIGGLLIGHDGLPAPDSILLSVRFGDQDLSFFRLASRAKETKLGQDLRDSLRRYLDKPDRPEPTALTTSENTTNAQVRFSRRDLEEAYALALSSDTSLNDVIVAATDIYLAECQMDPELQAKIQEYLDEEAVIYGPAEIRLARKEN